MTEIIKTARVDGRVDGWTGIGTLRGPRGPKNAFLCRFVPTTHYCQIIRICCEHAVLDSDLYSDKPDFTLILLRHLE